MKSLIFLCVVVAATAVREPVEKTCWEEPETGLCKAYIPSYYYNQKTGRCESFVYGGCGGNGNRYATKKDCEENCAAPQAALDRPDCDKAPEAGLCDAYMPRYYYDQEAGQCKTFIYGGCGGNRNNFRTEEECYNKCGALRSASVCEQEKETGPCYAYFPMYYYNKQSGECERFIYGGCQGNDNRFEKKEDCEAVCVETVEKTCWEQPETGLCRAYIPSYYYNQKTGTCESFVYGGCGGNGNRYATKKDCEENCAALRSASVCEQEKETGPCRAYFPMYYYNKQRGECERFIYGGCQGNDNRFQKKEDCEAVCVAARAPAKCHLKPETGVCKGRLPRYYYDDESGTCKIFIYGGCGGNENNFETEGECLDVCSA